VDETFAEMRKNHVPGFNPIIAKGIATAHVPHSLKLVDQVWESINREFPPGLVYVKSEYCSPVEEYREGARKRTPTRTPKRIETKIKRAPKFAFDLAPTTVRLAKFYFKFNGKDMAPRYMYIPYCEPGGLMTMAGSRFAISPILQDIVISPDENNVFAQLLCIKLIFRRQRYDFMVDNETRSTKVVWSMIYNKTEDMRKLTPTIKAVTCMPHYLFCKFGVRDTFKKYLGFVPEFSDGEFTDQTHPIDEWVVCESRGVRPENNPRLDYVKPKLQVAVRRSQWNNNVENMIGSLFYLVDHFPKRMVLNELDSTWLWQVLMGHILWTGDMNEGDLAQKIKNHFKSVDQYMDLITQQKLESIGIHVESTYDFFVHVMENFTKWTMNEAHRIPSMFGKEMSILNYLLYDITYSIVQTNFAIHTAYRRSLTDPKRPLTERTIEEIFKKRLKPGNIFKITNGRPGVSSIAIPGDNMVSKLTTLLVPQTSKNGRRDGNADATKAPDASVPQIGGFLNIQKKSPTGRTRANPWAHLTDSFITTENPEFAEVTERTQRKFLNR